MNGDAARGWYIDALDALGGLAFASWRTTDDGDTAYAEAAATAFISPPYFVPEPIVNRGTALAATRGTLQRGFFIGEDEYRFTNLAEIAEFVRRLYGGGNGGGGAGGAGTLPPPPPDAGEPVTPEYPTEGPDAGHALRDALDHFAKSVYDRPSEPIAAPAIEMHYTLATTWQQPDSWYAVPLISAGLRLHDELFSRELPNGDPNLLRWLRPYKTLLHLFGCLGIGSAIRERLPSPFPFDELAYAMRNPVVSVDPYEALRALPIPRGIARRLQQRLPGARVESLANLLALVFASPITAQDADMRAVTELVLFGAAAIVTADSRRLSAPTVSPAWMPAPYDDWESPPVLRAFTREVTDAALRWCEASLPRLAFHPALEHVIEGAATLHAG